MNTTLNILDNIALYSIDYIPAVAYVHDLLLEVCNVNIGGHVTRIVAVSI